MSTPERRTIPVQVDSLKTMLQPPLVRFTYFTVECDAPTLGGSVKDGGAEIPLLITELSGVVLGHGPEGTPLDAPEKIESLIEAVEADPGLYVDTQDLWVPLAFCPEGEPPRHGEVLRMDGELFIAAHAYRFDRGNLEVFESLRDAERDLLRRSPEETAAFAAWGDRVIETARRLKHANEHGMALPRTPSVDAE